VVADTRGQALTLEGISAAIILLAAVGFALQVTAVTPLSPSTSSQHVESQIQSTAEGALDSAAQDGTLGDSLLFWDADEGQFHNASEDVDHYKGRPPERLPLSETLERTFDDRNVAYNVVVNYHTDRGRLRQRLVEQGSPSDHAVSASRTVVVHESDRLVRRNGTSGDRLGVSNFYAPNLDTDENLYNVLHVEVVAWRI
jgi:hypothetical protein